MTCREHINQNPILTARGLGFPEPELPPNHVPDFSASSASGLPVCLRCEQPVTAEQWSGEACPGKRVAPGTAP